ncbi:hypothetical protein C0995_005545 [Termitomyces sp. Mi166|nr:hypothetical protein C0995_005545 [Termitomyces sp. Mi166\
MHDAFTASVSKGMYFMKEDPFISPPPPTLVFDNSDTESYDDEPLNTPTRVRKSSSHRINYRTRFNKPVREPIPSLETDEEEGIHLVEEGHVTETLSRTERLERERLVLSQKLKEVTETLELVTKELQRSDRDLDKERRVNEATKAQLNRLNHHLHEEYWSHEATKVQLHEERRMHETTKAQVDQLGIHLDQVDQLGIHLDKERRAHDTTQAELDRLKDTYRRLQVTTARSV